MVYYTELHGDSTIHLVRGDLMALCMYYTPNWCFPQEPYNPKSVCVTCMAELVIWQLAGKPAPNYVWYDRKVGQLIHE